MQAVSTTDPHAAIDPEDFLCSSVVMLLQAKGPEDLIEHLCGGSLPPGGGKQYVEWWRHAQNVRGKSCLQTLSKA